MCPYEYNKDFLSNVLICIKCFILLERTTYSKEAGTCFYVWQAFFCLSSSYGSSPRAVSCNRHPASLECRTTGQVEPFFYLKKTL